MARIALINACLGGDLSAMDIAITALATYINKRTQHQAGIVDLVFHRRHWRKHMWRELNDTPPDLVGISTNTLYLPYVRQVAQEVKKQYGPPIILGGHHASVHPVETFDWPEVDMLCVGDGEYALAEVLDRWETGNMEGIPGIWAKTSNVKFARGDAIRNRDGCFIPKLATLPDPDWNLWKDLDKYFYYLGMIYLQFSRGCPYKCEFCDAWGISQAVVHGKYFRLMDPKASARQLYSQWNKYKDRGLRLAQIFDPVFTFDRGWVDDFCKEYVRLGAPLKFSAFSRIDNLDEKKIEALAEARCALLRVGIEAGDEDIRNRVYEKKVTDEKIMEITALAKKAGIGFTAFYILGGPGETPQTVQRTIDMAVEIDAARSAFFIYKPFTLDAAKLVTEHGGWIDEKRWAKADNITFDAVVGSPSLSPKEVERYQRKAYFLTFGRRLIRMIRRQKLTYFTRLVAYMWRGTWNGLSWAYLLAYYHIYGYSNVDQ